MEILAMLSSPSGLPDERKTGTTPMRRAAIMLTNPSISRHSYQNLKTGNTFMSRGEDS
jgi:hypothetical protein